MRLYLTALMQLVIEKGLVKPEEIQAKLISLLPPIPAATAGDDNPFAGLR